MLRHPPFFTNENIQWFNILEINFTKLHMAGKLAMGIPNMTSLRLRVWNEAEGVLCCGESPNRVVAHAQNEAWGNPLKNILFWNGVNSCRLDVFTNIYAIYHNLRASEYDAQLDKHVRDVMTRHQEYLNVLYEEPAKAISWIFPLVRSIWLAL